MKNGGLSLIRVKKIREFSQLLYEQKSVNALRVAFHYYVYGDWEKIEYNQ